MKIIKWTSYNKFVGYNVVNELPIIEEKLEEFKIKCALRALDGVVTVHDYAAPKKRRKS